MLKIAAESYDWILFTPPPSTPGMFTKTAVFPHKMYGL